MLTARSIAAAYDEFISAYWRGDDGPIDLCRWLEAHRTATRPLLDAEVVARSPHAAGGRGIEWHQTATHAIGVVPGEVGCYLLPLEETVPTPSRPPARRHNLPKRIQRDACDCRSPGCRAGRFEPALAPR